MDSSIYFCQHYFTATVFKLVVATCKYVPSLLDLTIVDVNLCPYVVVMGEGLIYDGTQHLGYCSKVQHE